MQGGSVLRTASSCRWKLPAFGGSSITEEACPVATLGVTLGVATTQSAWVGRGSAPRPRSASAARPLRRSRRGRGMGCCLLRLTKATASSVASCPLPPRLLGARSLPAPGSLRLGSLAVPSRRPPVLPGTRRRPPPAAAPCPRSVSWPHWCWCCHLHMPTTPRMTSVELTARLRLATTGRVVVLRLRCCLVHLVVLPRVPVARSSPAVGVPTLGGSGGGVRSPGGGSPERRSHPRVAAAGFRPPAAEADHDYPPLRSDSECWVAQEGRKVRLGMPACLAGRLPPEPPAPPARLASVIEEQWLEWRQQQLDTLSAAEVKAAAREADAGASPRVPVWVPPPPRAGSASADGSAVTGSELPPSPSSSASWTGPPSPRASPSVRGLSLPSALTVTAPRPCCPRC